MSDFLFHSKKQKENILSNLIKSIYTDNPPEVFEFHGQWGSLAISKNTYFGFEPVETENHIYFIIGGPVLTFTDNKFLSGSDSQKGIKKIIDRKKNNNITWDEDLSGPFIFGSLNKNRGKLDIVTDMVSFIPVYNYLNSEEIALGTHVDKLANLIGIKNEFDKVSIVDFILNGIVTYPYSFFENIKQLSPSCIHKYDLDNIIYSNSYYWKPYENIIYNDISQEAKKLREYLKEYINSVTDEMNEVASFISGGEDSRAVLSMLPHKLETDTYIFLDHMNREGKVAKKTAESFNANFHMEKRSKLHYLEILESASKFIGSGSEYIHGHSFGLSNKCRLNEYNAVFGGLFSDLFLKGSRINKIRYSGKLPLFPEIKADTEASKFNINKSLIDDNIALTLYNRKMEQYNRVKNIRPKTADEWYWIWPVSMANSSANISFNRRLFKEYDPFLSNDIIKFSASIPQEWKLNKKIFNKTIKPFFEDVKFLPHASGGMPYFSWKINTFLKFSHIIKGKMKNLFKEERVNHGPWGDWNKIQNSSLWEEQTNKYIKNDKIISGLFDQNLKELFETDELKVIQKVDLLESLHMTQSYQLK